MRGAGVGVLAKVGRRQVCKPVANRLPLLHVCRITTSTARTAKVRIALLDLGLGGAVLRAGGDRGGLSARVPQVDGRRAAYGVGEAREHGRVQPPALPVQC